MRAGIIRPVLVVGILLAAGSYAATKEWQWQADADPVPLLRVAQPEREGADAPRGARWWSDGATAQPGQIFQD